MIWNRATTVAHQPITQLLKIHIACVFILQCPLLSRSVIRSLILLSWFLFEDDYFVLTESGCLLFGILLVPVFSQSQGEFYIVDHVVSGSCVKAAMQ